jgi:hypothetical protein
MECARASRIRANRIRARIRGKIAKLRIPLANTGEQNGDHVALLCNRRWPNNAIIYEITLAASNVYRHQHTGHRICGHDVWWIEIRKRCRPLRAACKRQYYETFESKAIASRHVSIPWR